MFDLKTKKIEVRQLQDGVTFQLRVDGEVKFTKICEEPNSSESVLNTIRTVYAQGFLECERWASLGYSCKIYKPSQYETPNLNFKPHYKR